MSFQQYYLMSNFSNQVLVGNLPTEFGFSMCLYDLCIETKLCD